MAPTIPGIYNLVQMRIAIHNGHVLGAVAFVAPILGLYAPLGLAPLAALGAVGTIAVRLFRGEHWPIPHHRAAWILTALVAWALATVAWGIEPVGSAAFGLLRLSFMLFCGLTLIEGARGLAFDEREVVRRWLIGGFVLALCLLAFDRVTDASIRRLYLLPDTLSGPRYVMENFNRGISVIAVLAFPAALALWHRHRRRGVVLWLATFALCVSLPSGSSQLAMAVGGVIALVAFIRPRTIAIAVAIAVTILTITAPCLMQLIPPPDKMPALGTYLMPNSGHHRLQIWRFTSDRILQRPWIGWGYDSSRSIPGGSTILGPSEPALPLHPHNAMLQWWLELGLPGGLLGAALLGSVALALGRKSCDRSHAVAGLGGFSSAVTLAALSFGTWQGWWVATLGLGCAIMISIIYNDDKLNSRNFGRKGDS